MFAPPPLFPLNFWDFLGFLRIFLSFLGIFINFRIFEYICLSAPPHPFVGLKVNKTGLKGSKMGAAGPHTDPYFAGLRPT